jgi:hypothetical protein
MLTYRRISADTRVLEIDVQTFPGRAHGSQPNCDLTTVHTATGQDVVLCIRVPADP